uniref:Putative secreted salivary protein n=1 Tax=Rhipicephalus pulchellus TaxID=72859 RepID=L7M1N5_RHIPC
MRNLTACLITFTLITISYDWQPSSNVLVEAGGAVYSSSNCWRHDCLHSKCPGNCRCPGPISRLFGRTSCY